MSTDTKVITVAHSPDSDDAFMHYALAEEKIPSEGIQFKHLLKDIETLNRWALEGRYEVSAVSIHAYAYLADKYALLPHGASMGDKYGPIVVAREPMTVEELAGKRVAIPGKMTTAWLALQLAASGFEPVERHRLSRDDDRAVARAHAGAVRKEHVLVLDVRVRVKRNRGRLEPASRATTIGPYLSPIEAPCGSRAYRSARYAYAWIETADTS